MISSEPASSASSARPVSRAAILGVLLAGGLAASLLLAQDQYAALRYHMVQTQIVKRGIREPRVLSALREVPRHFFVQSPYTAMAYQDRPLPIGHSQTISQPYIVALMTELLKLGEGSKVLEIGTGSGYHAAVLSRVAGEVYTIEIVRPLGERARRTLEVLGYDNVHVRIGDGYQGWKEAAPFDAILLTAAPPEVPKPLIDQLAIGGRMVLPEGSKNVQDLLLLTKTAERVERQVVTAVRFVPMTGQAQERR